MSLDSSADTGSQASAHPLLQSKVNAAIAHDTLLGILCEGVKRNVGLKTLATLARAAGVTGNDTTVRKTVELLLEHCVAVGRISPSLLRRWHEGVRHVNALEERQVWVREQLERLVDCRCDPHLDTLLRRLHHGGQLAERDIPWKVIVQAMQLIDDGEWTIEKCKLQARFRSTGRRRSAQAAEGHIPENLLRVAERIVQIKDEPPAIAKTLEQLLGLYEKRLLRLSSFQFRILRTLYTMLKSRIRRAQGGDAYRPLLRRAEALLHPDGPVKEIPEDRAAVSEDSPA